MGRDSDSLASNAAAWWVKDSGTSRLNCQWISPKLTVATVRKGS